MSTEIKDMTLTGFWKVDRYPRDSVNYVDNLYEVDIPWKEKPELSDNYDVALDRLRYTDQKLNRHTEVAAMYNIFVCFALFGFYAFTQTLYTRIIARYEERSIH